MNENEKVFAFLEEEKLSLENRMYLARLQKELQLKLSAKDLKEIITDFSFFKKYQYLYWWISNGEQLSTENLDSAKDIIAVRKCAKLQDGKHEVRIYKPSRANS